MVSGAKAAPESMRNGELELRRSVKLSGETDCVTAPFRSVPSSPNDPAFSTFNNKQFVLFAEQIVCYRGGRRDASLASWRGATRISVRELRPRKSISEANVFHRNTCLLRLGKSGSSLRRGRFRRPAAPAP